MTETRLVSKTAGTPADIVTAASYPAACDTTNALYCNQPSTTTDALGRVTNYTYDPAHGGVLSVKAPAPDPAQPTVRPETRYSYTQLGSNGAASSTGVWMLTGVSTCATGVTCTGTASERKTTITYGAGLNPVSVTTASGDTSASAPAPVTVSASYDAVGNIVSVDGPLPGTADTVRMRYDVLRRPLGQTSPLAGGSSTAARATRISYNTDGTVASTELGTDSTPAAADFGGFTTTQRVNSSYDSYHRKVKDVMIAGGATFAVAQQSYDALGRLDCTVTRMDPAQWGGQTDACTPQTTGPNGPDRVTRQAYGAAGREVRRFIGLGTAAGSSETVAYTPGGQVASITDGEFNTTSYTYDGFDRLVRTNYPVTGQGWEESSASDYEELGYDANGNITSQRTRSGNLITSNYDALDRVTSRVIPGDGDPSFSYDLLGQVTQVSTGAQALNFGYDALGRRTSESGPHGAMVSQFDAAGRRTRLTWPDGFYVTYEYDNLGQMTAIRENGGALVLASFTCDNLGQRRTLTRGNGAATTYDYDAVSRLATLANVMPGSTSYNVSSTFTYNPAGQIVTRSRNNDYYTWLGSMNVDRPYTVNGLNQYVTAGAVNFGYDGRGNLTTSGADTYGYTTQNLLLTGPGGTTLAYDPLLRLYSIDKSSVVTKFAYDGAALTAEYNASNVLTRRYVHGPGSDEPLVWYAGTGTTDRRYLQADERGSVIAVTNASGAATAINKYDEYGIGNPTGRFGYTGQKWISELGIYDYKARMYSPTLGRFMQTDPIGYADGMNWYNYAGSDPVNATDPSGNNWCYNCDIVVTAAFNIGSIPGFLGLPMYASLSYIQGIYGNTLKDFKKGAAATKPQQNTDICEKNINDPACEIIVGGGRLPQSAWGHYYEPYNQISDGKCNLSNSERRYLAQHFSTPFNAGAAAVNGRVTLYGSNPIAQRITNNGFTVVNQTLPGHQLHSDSGGGSVTRTVLVGENGALYTSTIGQGTNYSRFMAGVNQLGGPAIFASLDSAMADYVKGSGICN